MILSAAGKKRNHREIPVVRRGLSLKFSRAELIDHLVKAVVYFADLRRAKAFYSKAFRNLLNLTGRNSVKPAFLHDLNESLLASFLLRHKERNVTSLPYLGHRKINGSEPRVKASDSVAAPVTGTAFSVNPFFSSCFVSNFNFHELVHYPLKHFKHRIFCRYKIQ